MRGSWAGFSFVIYNQTTDLGQGPFTSCTGLFKTLTQWKMPKVQKGNIPGGLGSDNQYIQPLPVSPGPQNDLLLWAWKTEPLLGMCCHHFTHTSASFFSF